MRHEIFSQTYADHNIHKIFRCCKVNEDKIIKEEPDLEERVEKLENLSKVGTLRSCEEYAAYGIGKSNYQFKIPPLDGACL